MKKENKKRMTIRVDSITDEYTLTIPETFCNELDWYEGSDVIISIDGDGIYIEEA